MSSTKNKKQIGKKVNKIIFGLLTKNISFSMKDNTHYKLCILLKCIVFCAMRELYFESGLEEFTNRIKQKTPNADTVNRRIRKKTKEEIAEEFMKTQDKILSKFRKARLLNRRVTAFIDKTEIPYWGDKNDKGIVGTKKQKGTYYCFKYITINILVKKVKLCLHILPVTAFSNNTKLVDELITVTKKKDVRIGAVLVDREFANSKIIPVFEKHQVKYLAPIEKNPKIKNLISMNVWKEKYIHNIYEFENRVCTTLFFIRNDTVFDGNTPIWKCYHVFCTNLCVTDENRGILAEVYRRRWNIENFYRDGKGNFLVKTKSKEFNVRMFFFLLCALLYNLWQLIRMVAGNTIITAQHWKTEVYELLYSKSNLLYKSGIYEEMIWSEILFL